MYVFSDSLSIIETIPVDLNGTAYEKSKEFRDIVRPVCDPISSKKENLSNGNLDSATRIKSDHGFDESKLKTKDQPLSSKKPEKVGNVFEDSTTDSKNSKPKNILPVRNLQRTVNVEQQASLAIDTIFVASDTVIPSEWVPPNLTAPILDLVDVILQLKDGGWIRRKAFWVAKQILQLGMGDAFDDWLIEKIQLLRRGSVVASGIRRLEQILWPDGIFITKHPRRQRPPPASTSHDSPGGQPPTPFSSTKLDNIRNLEEMQQNEAERRAKLVYELMIDKAPAAIVGLVGRKEYEQCAKDLYYFIQSTVFMKQLAFNLLELLLLSTFPELDYVFRQLEEERQKFGELQKN